MTILLITAVSLLVTYFADRFFLSPPGRKKGQVDERLLLGYICKTDGCKQGLALLPVDHPSFKLIPKGSPKSCPQCRKYNLEARLRSPTFTESVLWAITLPRIGVAVASFACVGSAFAGYNWYVGVPKIKVPSQVTFPLVKVSESRDEVIQIANEGTGKLKVSSVTADSSEFSVDPSSLVVLPGAKGSVRLSFKPSAAGVKTASLTFRSNADEAIEVKTTINAKSAKYDSTWLWQELDKSSTFGKTTSASP